MERDLDDVFAQLALLTAAVQAIELRLPSPLVSPKEAAIVLGCSEDTVRRLVASGELPHTRVGHLVRVDISKARPDIKALIAKARPAVH